MASAIKVVAIYALADEPLWQDLKVFISAMQHQGLLNILLWDLGELSPGRDREKTITQRINEAQLALLLLSSHLLAMDLLDIVSPPLLQRNAQNAVRVLPILLRPVSWKETSWGKLTALPDNEKPVTIWRNRQEAYLNIAEGVRQVVKELQPRHVPAIQEDRRYLPAQGYTLLQTLTAHLGPVASVVFSPDGTLLASDSWDGTISIWEMPTRRELRRLQGHTSLIYSLAFSPDGRILASAGEDSTIRLWALPTGKRIRTLCEHTHAVSNVSFSPDGRWLMSGSDDHTIRIWDVPTGKVRTTLSHTQAVLSAAWLPDSRLVLSGGADHTLKVWDTVYLQEFMSSVEHIDSIHSVAVSLDGRSFASGSADHTIKLWRGGVSEPAKLTLQNHHGVVSSVAFRADGALLASGSYDKTIKLWDVSSGEELGTLVGHTEAVLSVAFHPNLPLLASGSFDKTVKLWGRR